MALTNKEVKPVTSGEPASRSVRPRLSDREHEILRLLTLGRQNKEIVNELDISPSTAATHIRRIYEKLHVHSRAEAVGKFATMVPR